MNRERRAAIRGLCGVALRQTRSFRSCAVNRGSAVADEWSAPDLQHRCSGAHRGSGNVALAPRGAGRCSHCPAALGQHHCDQHASLLTVNVERRLVGHLSTPIPSRARQARQSAT